MKEETKQKLNEVKEYVIEHNGDIIAFCAVASVNFAIGVICGKIIGQHISNTIAKLTETGGRKA